MKIAHILKYIKNHIYFDINIYMNHFQGKCSQVKVLHLCVDSLTCDYKVKSF